MVMSQLTMAVMVVMMLLLLQMVVVMVQSLGVDGRVVNNMNNKIGSLPSLPRSNNVSFKEQIKVC
jgi:hypothetical protein